MKNWQVKAFLAIPIAMLAVIPATFYGIKQYDKWAELQKIERKSDCEATRDSVSILGMVSEGLTDAQLVDFIEDRGKEGVLNPLGLATARELKKYRVKWERVPITKKFLANAKFSDDYQARMNAAWEFGLSICMGI